MFCRHTCLKEIELKRKGESSIGYREGMILLDNFRFRYNGEDDEDSEDTDTGTFPYPLVSLINLLFI